MQECIRAKPGILDISELDDLYRLVVSFAATATLADPAPALPGSICDTHPQRAV
eukprot:COSAG06_NODE_270_length_18720_cov_149.982708_9_plen_54_part_00